MRESMSTFYHENDYRDYLQHYGVQGMKWGVRKAGAYDAAYYRAKYNNKKVKAFKDLKEGNISKGKFVGKRAGQMAGHYMLDPWKQVARGIGRDVRGWYRLLTGNTYRKTNEQEYKPAEERAMSQISDKGQQHKIRNMVQENLSNKTAVSFGSNGVVNIQDYDAIIDQLDRIALKDIEKLNR